MEGRFCKSVCCEYNGSEIPNFDLPRFLIQIPNRHHHHTPLFLAEPPLKPPILVFTGRELAGHPTPLIWPFSPTFRRLSSAIHVWPLFSSVCPYLRKSNCRRVVIFPTRVNWPFRSTSPDLVVFNSFIFIVSCDFEAQLFWFII